MPRYKGRASAKEIEKDFPHTVEMRVPLGGLGSKLNAMHQWHEARGIRAIHSTGRRDENNRDYIRWCFAESKNRMMAATMATYFHIEEA
jgi:hypothetical protein